MINVYHLCYNPKLSDQFERISQDFFLIYVYHEFAHGLSLVQYLTTFLR